ncbi:hypothetical protein M011DRAFT_462978 [Sporormia fimetaria CBS 119925]|uniref:Uncharacterized protein n=1 Tax=Sporormia fimetaria CBS 119925 TaxID=1340428 RepID=A0A6A6UVB3_9PLEO|nr:hypothetical protein M011DRAFT_462978 [Sporormia fimetaria CBS 119925]
MTSSPDPTVSNLSQHLQKQRNQKKTLEKQKSRRRNASRDELGRGDKIAEKATSATDPKEIANSPPIEGSPPTPPQPTQHAITSPLLSGIDVSATPAGQYTSEWASSIAMLGPQASPNSGGIAISPSPPALQYSPSPRAHMYGQAQLGSSPRAAAMRPLSHPNHYSSFGGRLHGSPHGSPGPNRRSSMYSQLGKRASVGSHASPPLPHQPQGHFYNLPDMNTLGLEGVKNGATAGEGGYYCGFDTLCMAGDEPAKVSENVLIVGYSGGVDIIRVDKRKLDLVGRLQGLQGNVIGAKILPWTARHDPMFAWRPLIALILHGPVLSTTESADVGGAAIVDNGASESPSRPASAADNAPMILGYQTTVEVFTLKERTQIATLYKSPLLPLTTPVDSPFFQPPPPTGDFVVDAKGKFVVVASGASGEVFIFAPIMQRDAGLDWCCIGKVWTNVVFREKASQSGSSSAGDGNQDDACRDRIGAPVFSLSDRWLAVAPPDSSTLLPLDGEAVTSPAYDKPPGLDHHAVPPQPVPNCWVDAPESGFVDRLAREGTQVAMKGARWATEKGMQAFRSYMNKGTQANGYGAGAYYGSEPAPPQYFPPTHAQNQSQSRQETSVISIYDLQRLVDSARTKTKAAVQPVATIPAPAGCSHLSLTPGGLMLMTVSGKGDLQDVWDLKRMASRRTHKLDTEPSGAHVRQVARFARMTVTNVVDVVWSSPKPNRVAVITDNRTVHMFLMPSSAFQWPPSRRVPKSGSGKPTADSSTGKDLGGAVSSAMQVINGTAKPFLNAVRTRNTGSGPRFPSLSSLGITPAAGAKSGKAVAAGVGKSINNIRHAGDNKLSLPTSRDAVKPSSVRWFSGRGRGCIGLVAGGRLQIFRVYIRQSTDKGTSSYSTSISKKKIAELAVDPVPDGKLPPVVAMYLDQCLEEPQSVRGVWLPRSLPKQPIKRGVSTAPVSQSEIESNPPFKPFHANSKAARFKFTRKASPGGQENGEVSFTGTELVSNLHANGCGSWLFGEEVEATRVSALTSRTHDFEDDEFTIIGVAARVENRLTLGNDGEEVSQVYVRTRPRRGRVLPTEEGHVEDERDVLEEGYKHIITDIDPLNHPDCVKLAISKGLSYGIIGASGIVKIPQLLKLLNSQSSEGVSFLSYLLESGAYLISLSYNIRHQFPFSTYGETALILVQNIVIASLVLQYGGKTSGIAAWIAGLGAAGAALFREDIVDVKTLNWLQAGSGVLGVASKVPQIVEIARNGGTGQLSAFTVMNYLLGSASRIYTTLQEVNDPLILWGYIAGFVLNLILAFQVIYYWNSPASRYTPQTRKPRPITAEKVNAGSSSSYARVAAKSPSTRRRG